MSRANFPLLELPRGKKLQHKKLTSRDSKFVKLDNDLQAVRQNRSRRALLDPRTIDKVRRKAQAGNEWVQIKQKHPEYTRPFLSMSIDGEAVRTSKNQNKIVRVGGKKTKQIMPGRKRLRKLQ